MAKLSKLLNGVVGLLPLVATFGAVSAQTWTAITGVTTGCANRLKIETMALDQPYQYNLLLLSLARMMSLPETDDFSWYQIAGIHGAPHIPWQQPANGNYNWDNGYCTHHSVLFGTWHRPYQLVLEQALSKHAVDIANQFTGTAKAKYQVAAAQLRFPYWDWSDPNTQSYLPIQVTKPTVQVIIPDASGNPLGASIPNPLYSYYFKGNETGPFFNQFANWNHTARRPDSLGNTNEASANSTMQSEFITRRQATFNSFSQTTFNSFSNAVENIHDSIHGAIGGNGHMSYVPYASFDPIFWLHHNNVDRLFAMWQAANPGLTLSPGEAGDTFARIITAQDNQDNINTPLYPFRRSSGAEDWWTSAHASSPYAMWGNGYGFPEVPCSYASQSLQALDSFVTTQINALYAPANGGSKKRSISRVKRAASTKSLEWEAKVVVDQSELFGSFTVYLYFGKPEADHKMWPVSKKEVGSLTSNGIPDAKKRSMIRRVAIPLGPYLEANGVAGGPEEISAYLEKELTWVVLNNGNPVDVASLKTLKVAVTATEVTTPEAADKLPVWGKASYYIDTTSGKIGGATSPSDIEEPTLVNGETGKPATG